MKPIKKFKVRGPKTIKELRDHPDVRMIAGPYTDVFDASEEKEIKKASGENKWYALFSMYGTDEDEIACARGIATKDDGFEWFCLAVKVSI